MAIQMMALQKHAFGLSEAGCIRSLPAERVDFAGKRAIVRGRTRPRIRAIKKETAKPSLPAKDLSLLAQGAVASFLPILTAMPASANSMDNPLQAALPWIIISLGACLWSVAKPPLASAAQPRVAANKVKDKVQEPEKELVLSNIVAAPTKVEKLAPAAVSLVEEWRGPDADEYGRGANAVLTQPVKLSVEDTVVTALEEPATVPVFKEGLVLEAEGIQTTPESPSFLSLEARTLGSVQGEDAVIAMAGSSQKPELLKTPTQEMDSAVTEPSEATVFEEFSAAEPASKLPSSADPLTHMTVGDFIRQHTEKAVEEAETAAPFAAATSTAASEPTPAAVPARNEAEQAKRSYETTVATLKQKAAKRNEQDTRRWEARRQLVQQIYDSAQARVGLGESGSPSKALVRLVTPARQLATLPPIAFLTQVMGQVVNAWKWVAHSVRGLLVRRNRLEEAPSAA